jgi:hypothetical protein
MKSPFPGMDPYLERHWTSVHVSLIALSAEQLNAVLPSWLVARSEEELVIDSDDWEDDFRARPDVRVSQPGASTGAEGGTVLDAPFKLVVDLEPFTERWVKIIRPENERVVTVIEFISPRNKRGGLEEYQNKRRRYLSAGVNLVEVDLVRRGNWRALLRPHVCPVEAEATYRTTIRPGFEGQATYLYPMPLDKPLHPIPVPLRTKDERAELELQPLIDRTYKAGRYGDTLDYYAPLTPPLNESDSAIAKEFLQKAGIV